MATLSVVGKWIVGQHPQYGHWCVMRENESGGISSKGCKTREEAEAKLAEMAANGACRECGDVLEDTYCEPYKTRIHEQQTCFICLFWLEYVEKKANPNHVMVNGNHYVIEPDVPKHREHLTFVGHGGAEFVIKFNDGREVVTRNLWAQGIIPKHFRERLPDNAVFVQRGHKRIGSFAGFGGAGSADAACNDF